MTDPRLHSSACATRTAPLARVESHPGPLRTCRSASSVFHSSANPVGSCRTESRLLPKMISGSARSSSFEALDTSVGLSNGARQMQGP